MTLKIEISVLSLKWTQTVKMKQNQTFSNQICSNLKPYLFFLPKNIKVFQWLTRSKFFSFMTKVNSNNGNETKSDNFPRDTFKPDIINFLTKNIKAIQ